MDIKSPLDVLDEQIGYVTAERDVARQTDQRLSSVLDHLICVRGQLATLNGSGAPIAPRAAKGAIEDAVLLAFEMLDAETMDAEAICAHLDAFKPKSIRAVLDRLVRAARLDLVDGRYRMHSADPVLRLDAAE